MSVVFERADRATAAVETRSDVPIGTGFGQALRAGITMNPQFKGKYVRQQWAPIVDQIEEITGESFYNPGEHLQQDLFQAGGRDSYLYAYQGQVARIRRYVRENRESLPVELVTTVLDPDMHKAWEEGARQYALAEMEALETQTEMQPGLGASLGRLAGSLVAGLDDPVTQSSLLIGAGRGSLWNIALQEAAINAGFEAIQQPAVKEWYDELGLDYDWADFYTNVIAAGALAGAAPLAMRAGGKAVRLTTEQARRGYEALISSGARDTDVSAAARILGEAEEFDFTTSPFADTPAGRAAHMERLRTAERQLAAGEAVRVEEPPADLFAAAARRPTIQSLTRADIRVDPSSPAGFELKARGVTPRTAPGLFSVSGVRDLDNIVASEFPDLAEVIRVADDKLYFDRDDLIEAITDDVRGRPRMTEEARNRSVMAEEAERAGPDAMGVRGQDLDVPPPGADLAFNRPGQRALNINEAVGRAEREMGVRMTPAERAEVVRALDEEGGVVADRIVDVVSRSELEAPDVEPPATAPTEAPTELELRALDAADVSERARLQEQASYLENEIRGRLEQGDPRINPDQKMQFEGELDENGEPLMVNLSINDLFRDWEQRGKMIEVLRGCAL